jgi:Transposase Tn5 dimerisation domain
MFCILSWRIFWLTMLTRSTRQAKATLAFTPLEIELLNRLAPEHHRPRSDRPPSLQSCLLQLARLGGYLNRASDPPPGNTVIWRGMSRLTDIEIGFQMGAQDVGN